MNIATTHPAIPALRTALTALERVTVQMAAPEAFPHGTISGSLTEAYDAYRAATSLTRQTDSEQWERLVHGVNLLGSVKDDVVFGEERGIRYRSGDFVDVLKPNGFLGTATSLARHAVEVLQA